MQLLSCKYEIQLCSTLPPAALLVNSGPKPLSIKGEPVLTRWSRDDAEH